MEQQVGSLIANSSSEVGYLSENIEKLKNDFLNAEEQVKQIEGGVESASRTLQLTLQGQTDPVGDYQRLYRELKKDQEKLLDPETRKAAEIIFRKLLRSSELQGVETQTSTDSITFQSHVLAEVLYNASGTASEFEMAKLSSELAKAANAGRPTPEHEARMYRAMIQAEEIGPKEGFDQVFTLIDSLDKSSTYALHFVISEAFNVAYSSGRLRELNAVLKSLESKLGGEAPSYVAILQAKNGLFLGTKSDVKDSIKALRDGLNRANDESPNAWWMGASIATANEVVVALLKHPTYRSEAETIVDEYRDLLVMKVEDDEQERAGGVSQNGDEVPIGDLLEQMIEELSAVPTDDVAGLELDVGASISDEGGGSDSGWHWFEFKPGKTSTYVVSAYSSGAQVDPLIIVKDREDNLLGRDDDGGDGLSARLEISLQKEHIYYIGVRSATNGTIYGAKVEIVDVGKQ